jgi:VRR-NUC domain
MNLTPLEYDEQVAIIEWCDCHPDPRPRRIYSHLNGVRLHPKVAKDAKAAGARKGIPDLFLPIPEGYYHGLYIELKRTKGGILSMDQEEYIQVLRDWGYRVEVCYGAQQAIEAIKNYLNIK